MYNIWYNYICMYSWLWLSHPPQKRESHVESSSNLLGCKTNHRLYKDGVNAFTFTIFHNVMCNVPKIIGYNPTVFVKHEKTACWIIISNDQPGIQILLSFIWDLQTTLALPTSMTCRGVKQTHICSEPT